MMLQKHIIVCNKSGLFKILQCFLLDNRRCQYVFIWMYLFKSVGNSESKDKWGGITIFSCFWRMWMTSSIEIWIMLLWKVYYIRKWLMWSLYQSIFSKSRTHIFQHIDIERCNRRLVTSKLDKEIDLVENHCGIIIVGSSWNVTKGWLFPKTQTKLLLSSGNSARSDKWSRWCYQS